MPDFTQPDPIKRPLNIDVKKDRGITIQWDNDTTSYYSTGFLRKMSPSADMRTLREEIEKNPLAILPSAPDTGPLLITNVKAVGNYAIAIDFSDGHNTGIYSWQYLLSIDPQKND